MSSVTEQITTNTNYSNMARANQSTSNASTNTNSSNSTVSSQDFLYLLTLQLQYQDPTNPMDNSEMLAQEAQFSTLEQLEALTSSFSQFSTIYQANSLLGQTVEVTVDGESTKGTIDYIDYSDTSGAAVSIDGNMYPLSSVTKVYPQDNTTSADDTEDKNFIKEALSYMAYNLGTITNALTGGGSDGENGDTTTGDTTSNNNTNDGQ